MRKVISIFLAVASFSSVAQANMAVDWEWKMDHRCANASPALSISGIPEGTKTLAIKMNDLDFQFKDHGGGLVAHDGKPNLSIPEGGLKENYFGPCPNNFSSFGHKYQFTVRALGSDGSEIDKAVAAKDFSASTVK